MSEPAYPVVAALLRALQLVEHELLLFAVFWFVLGAIDELAIDLRWLWLRLTGRIATRRIVPGAAGLPISGIAAVFIPAWQESRVIGVTIGHALAAWRQRDLRLYVGCYCNDPETVAAAVAAVGGDPRVRIVIHDRDGPTTKADCLNRLYEALCLDEARSGRKAKSVILHDAEDMVHPAELVVIDRALASNDFVQLPVRPEPQPGGQWIAGHYADEFAESHAKALVVRDQMGAALPAAGVGCGFSRDMMTLITAVRRLHGEAGPFAADSLTEDYELGLLIARAGGRSRFLRLRDDDGALVATRSYFPATLPEAVRQKTRWTHGIALQGWDRLGWTGSAADIWMALRDRRGPLSALVLAVAYTLLAIEALLRGGEAAGLIAPRPMPQLLAAMLAFSFAAFVWRAAIRFIFTGREYGWRQGAIAVLRIPVANIIAIMAGRRALNAYARSLMGVRVTWDKTAHAHHPAETLLAGAPA